MNNPAFSAKSKKGLVRRMVQDGANTFAKKVAWVKKHIPFIESPEGFVAWAVAGERRKRNPVRLKGGAETLAFARAVADAYEAAPLFDEAAIPSYEALAKSLEKTYKQILSKVRVEFVEGQPYADEKEMSDAVKKSGVLYISTDFNVHPFFTPEQNLKFRAVHDWYTHIATGSEFSQRGEIKSYNAQAKVTPRAALPALFTEVVGQAMYATVHGNFPEQKVAILKGFDYYNVGEGPAAPKKRNGVLEAENIEALLERVPLNGTKKIHDVSVKRLGDAAFSLDGGEPLGITTVIEKLSHGGPMQNPAARRTGGTSAAHVRSLMHQMEVNGFATPALKKKYLALRERLLKLQAKLQAKEAKPAAKQKQSASLMTKTQLGQVVKQAQEKFPAEDHLTVDEWIRYLYNQDMIEKVGTKYHLIPRKITAADVRDALYETRAHRNPTPAAHKARGESLLKAAGPMLSKGAKGSTQEFVKAAVTAGQALQDLKDGGSAQGAKQAEHYLHELAEKRAQFLASKKNPKSAASSKHHYMVLGATGNPLYFTTTIQEARSVVPKGGQIVPL